jgi:hypothetical protein
VYNPAHITRGIEWHEAAIATFKLPEVAIKPPLAVTYN